MQTIIVKGKSDKSPFTVEIPKQELMEFFKYAIDKAQEEYDAELATSPGGFSTALFTSMLGASHREAAGWNLEKDGWNLDTAKSVFDSRLERKTGGGVTIEQRQAAWDIKAANLRQVGLTPEAFIGKRPVAKA